MTKAGSIAFTPPETDRAHYEPIYKTNVQPIYNMVAALEPRDLDAFPIISGRGVSIFGHRLWIDSNSVEVVDYFSLLFPDLDGFLLDVCPCGVMQ